MQCARHRDRAAAAACVECGALVCEACRRLDDQGFTLCPGCAGGEEPAPGEHDLNEEAPALDAEVAVLAERPDPVQIRRLEPIPWESGAYTNEAAALRDTVLQAVFSPITFMQRVPWVRGDLRTPLVFALVVHLVGILGAVFAGVPVWPEAQMPVPLGDLPGPVKQLVVLPLWPILIALGLFVQAGLAHGVLGLIRAARRPYEATFRVFCYAQAAKVFLVFPVVGIHIDMMFTVLFVLSGLHAAHRTSFAAGLLALLPMMLAAMATGV